MKVTVITVCLNCADTIERAIKSVIGQSGEAVETEYVVIDGGSDDGTIDILRRYEDYIDTLIIEPDAGIFDAMNKGIGMATGDVIAFLNSDDWYEEGILAHVAECFRTEECGCVCCDNYVMEKNGRKVYFDTSMKTVADLHIHMIYYHSAIFCRKEFFKTEGNFDLRYRMAADYDWFLRIVENGARLCHMNRPAFTFSYGGISSANAIECAREARKIALLHMPADTEEYRKKINRRFYEAVLYAGMEADFCKVTLRILGEDRTNYLWGAGARGAQWVKWFQGAGVRIEGIVDGNHALWNRCEEGITVCPPGILAEKNCNVIITPEKYIEEIKAELRRMKNPHLQIFELDQLCKELAESVLAESLE